MSFRAITALVLVCCAAGSARADGPALRYVSDAAAARNGAVVIDTRPSATCEAQSLAGARCLSAADFLGPHDRLAGFADIAWVLGSAGLKGTEAVLVVGAAPQDRDFVAGVLYLMGQAHISVLARDLKTVDAPRAPGAARAMVRTTVWEAPARNDAVVFKTELRDQLSSGSGPVLLDGRDEKSYWGASVDAARGGHLPGADHLPASALRADVARGDGLGPTADDAVVYARGAVDGLAFLTLVVGGTGTPVRVYPGGWSEWAADGTLPVDSASYPVPASPPSEATSQGGLAWGRSLMAGGLGAVLGGMFAIGGYRMLRRGKAV